MNQFVFCVVFPARIVYGTLTAADGLAARNKLDQWRSDNGLGDYVRQDIAGVTSRDFTVAPVAIDLPL